MSDRTRWRLIRMAPSTGEIGNILRKQQSLQVNQMWCLNQIYPAFLPHLLGRSIILWNQALAWAILIIRDHSKTGDPRRIYFGSLLTHELILFLLFCWACTLARTWWLFLMILLSWTFVWFSCKLMRNINFVLFFDFFLWNGGCYNMRDFIIIN